MTTRSPSNSSGQSLYIKSSVTEKDTSVRERGRAKIWRKWGHISGAVDLHFENVWDLINPHLKYQRWQMRAFLATCQVKTGDSFNYEPLPPREQATFRLLTILPGEDLEEIHCQLTVALIHNAQYEALSYCWGNDKGLPAIICNGARMNVSRSLKRALKDLRYTDRPRILWADAVCINQGDLLEKESQVNLMGDIYRHAQRTIIHMHMTIDTMSVGRFFPVLQELHRLYQCLLAGEIDLVTIVDADELTPKGLDVASEFQLTISQEVALAQNVSVSYNGHEFEWDLFKEAIVMKSVILLEEKKAKLPTSLYDVFVLQLIAMRENFQKESAAQHFDLLSLLHYTRVFNSTNPLDKVYGILGLTNSDLGSMNLRPNYTRRPEDLYVDVALEVLKTSPSLDILSITVHPQATASIDNYPLPSWVPDWSNSLYYPRSLVFRKTKRSVYEFPPYNASKDYVYSFSLPPGNFRERLLVRGCFLDTISELTTIFRPTWNIADDYGDHKIRRHSNILKLPYELGALFFTTVARGTREGIEKKKLRDFFKNISGERSTYSPTNEPIQLAQMRTLCSGSLPFDDETRSLIAFKNWLKTDFGIEHDIRYELAEVGLHVPYSGMRPDVLFEELCCMVLGRRLLWTQSGYLGLAPPGAKKSDNVVILEGSRVPFILRKVDGGFWKVIGECYIHGIMYGEAFDSQKCMKIILV
ncbi:HET-domain-containing protein [Penicillium angulare]|uniref:HET-domain-containing protein n=1 Tax=Penicillium angulare TaxID=116970 RepID=UPI00253FC585|nr:HET-domain-containing protein [Penicillium angulare]KAJ5261074.1 HET-domain-containing protein [Penicillium angulare]